MKRRFCIYVKQRRSDEWQREKEITDRLLRDSKKAFYEKEKAKLTVEGSHTLPFRAVERLCDGDKPAMWDILNKHSCPNRQGNV